MGSRELRHIDHLRNRHAGLGKGDVVTDGAVEKVVFLEHNTHLTPEPRDIDHREISAIDEHAPAFRDIEPLHQLGEGRFARAGRTDDADYLA